jgi:hypothetical protein
MNYVSVIPGDNRNRNDPGWLACVRQGSIITRHRLSAPGRDQQAARMEAAEKYPTLVVVLPTEGDEYPTRLTAVEGVS